MRRSFLIIGSLLVLLTSGPSVSVAQDDGGGRSVFAYGAGSRALGLGGAYGAVANDASAVLWNPGGLGLVRRPGMEVTQASYYGFDISEQYASLVFPHWRYGTASLTFRRFGAGGIEHRDDRNALLSDDLSSTETELLLGFGRRLGTAWSVGGAVKLRRQTLADFGDSGVGLDLGVIFHPLAVFGNGTGAADRFAVGLSVRNAVQPELRLLDDRVADPAGVRLGMAYTMPVMGQQVVLAALDIEKTIDMNTRIHTGLEYVPHPLLRLRLGLNDGEFTAGTGAVWNGVSVDYTFEQNAVEDVHRIGATFSFGLTVDENRIAAMDARENELRARLDESFTRRQAARVDELLEQANEARVGKRYDEALVTLAAVAALDPDNRNATAARADCLYELARSSHERGDLAEAILGYSQALDLDPEHQAARDGYDRARAESDRLAQRGEERRSMFAAAMDAFVDRRLLEARAGFRALLSDSPADEEAAVMLERTQRAIEGEVSELLDQAGRYGEWGRFDDAEALIDRARALKPESADVVAATAALASRRTRAEKPAIQPVKPKDTPPVKTVTPEERREAERLYQRALEAVSERRSDDAIRYLELVWTIDPSYQRVEDHLKREYLTRGMEYFADGDLDHAIDLWERVLRVDPDDQRARGYLSRAREQATRTREILGGSR